VSVYLCNRNNVFSQKKVRVLEREIHSNHFGTKPKENIVWLAEGVVSIPMYVDNKLGSEIRSCCEQKSKHSSNYYFLRGVTKVHTVWNSSSRLFANAFYCS